MTRRFLTILAASGLRAGMARVSAMALLLAVGPAFGEDGTYEVVTSKVTYAVAPDMSLYVEPFMQLRLAPTNQLGPTQKLIPAFGDRGYQFDTQEGYRYALFISGNVTIRQPRPRESEDGVDLGLATSIGMMTAAVLAPAGVGAVEAAGMLFGTVEVGEKIADEQLPQHFSIDTKGHVRATGGRIESGSDLGVVMHMVEDHVMQLDSKPLLTSALFGMVFSKLAGKLFFPEHAGERLVAKSFDEAFAEESVGKLAETLGQKAGEAEFTSGGSGCQAPIPIAGMSASMPVICPTTLVAQPPILAAPQSLIFATAAMMVPAAGLAPLPPLPPALAALPVMRALQPALATAPASVEVSAPARDRLELRFRPVRPPPPPPAPVSAPSFSPTTGTPHVENWRGLPTGVTVNGPINGMINFSRHN